MFRIKGKFASRGKYIKAVLALGVVAGCGFAYLGEVWVPSKIEAFKAEPIIYERAEAAELTVFQPNMDVEAAKEKTIDILEKCEFGGHTWEEGFIRMDSNDKFSYGGMQFQKATVQHYMKKRTGKEISGHEAVSIALDREKARDLAKWVIFETNAGVAKDWVVCSRNYDIQTRVDVIKELMK